MIELQDVHKTYKMGQTNVFALRGVNLKVQRGEYIALMGPSGSGKSTLMHIIGCLDRPSSGKYSFMGKEVQGMDDTKLAKIRNESVGFVFQSFYLIPRLSASQNIELPLIYRGISSKERAKRAMEVLEKVGLKERATHKPTELSGGESQRVAIARALVTGADIILADEPTGNLDTKTGIGIMEIFKSLHNEGKTVVVVTHDPEIAKFAAKTLKMLDGRIVNEVNDEYSSEIERM